MVLYEDGGISIATIEEQDKAKVMQYFLENDFNCDGESGSLKPSERQFSEIIDGIISGEDDENNIFVLRKNDEALGYVSMFVEYNSLNLGHIAVNKNERGKGYGKLLTEMVTKVADHDGREVALFCMYPNSFWSELGFESHDGIHFLRQPKPYVGASLPRLFVSKEEYAKRKELESAREHESFVNFLKSDFMMNFLNNCDKDM